MAVVLCMSLEEEEEEEEEDWEICWMSSAQALGSSSSPHDGGGEQQSTSAAPASMAARQGTSMYNLTLSEVQDHLGEPLLSMNLDDLLRNVLPLPLEAGGGGDQPTIMEAVVEEEEEEEDDYNHQKRKKKTDDAEAFQSGSAVASSSSGYCGGMQRQQGNVTLLSSTVLSKKTVDEVWKDIQKGQPQQQQQQQQQQPPGEPDADGVAGGRQATLGEMTLEDFLMKAGVVAEGWDIGNQKADTGGDVGESVAPIAIGEGGVLPPPAHWLQQQRRFPHASLQQQQLRPVVVGGNYGLTPHHPMPLPLQAVASGATAAVVLDVGYSDQMGSISSPIRGTLSDSPAATARKRTASSAMVHGGDVVVEKTVERRQKRMIKNRESAARSRARKQAYTNELENKVSRLEEENELLKKQQELDRILHSTLIPEPKFRLRRTSSSPL